MAITRRNALTLAAVTAAGAALPRMAHAQDAELHGLSTFGDLSLPPDFKHFPYVNPNAPKGGVLRIQIKNTNGNQNFETFDTLHIYAFRGDGAAGMDATFDTLMSGSSDEPNSMYGLVAKSVRVSADKLEYRSPCPRPIAVTRQRLRIFVHDAEGKRAPHLSLPFAGFRRS